MFNRRQLLGLGVGAGAGALLAGCGVPGSGSPNTRPTIPPIAPGEKITLTYWAWLADLQKVADVWNAQNPNVHVQAVWTLGGNSGGYQKMFSALAAGGGPDLAQVELRTIPEFMLVDGLVDLTRYGVADHADQFDEAVWNQVTFNDGVFGVPQDSGPMGFFYQTELLDAVGAQPPKTWDEWAQLAAEIRKSGDDTYLESFPVSDGSLLVAYATQAGARWFTPAEDHWVVNMTDDASLQVARFFDKAIDDDLVQTGFAPYSPGWMAACGAGKIAAITSASWGDALIKSVSGGEGKWRVAPMQKWPSGGFGSSFLGGSTSAVLANSKHPKEALDFAIWLNTSKEGIDAMIANSGIGWSPSRNYIGEERQQPSQWFSGQNYNEEVFAPAIKEQNLDWSWWPITQRTFNQLADGLRKKLTQGKSIVDTLAELEALTVETFQHVGLAVRTEN